MWRKERSGFRHIEKSIGEVRAFEELNLLGNLNVANAFFNTANLQKFAELKSMSGLIFLLFNFALYPAFCQYNVTCSFFIHEAIYLSR